MPFIERFKFPLLVHLFFQVIGFALLFYWLKHIPAPSIAAVWGIGVIAIIMTISDTHWPTKTVWLILVFGFAGIETKAIAKDRTEVFKSAKVIADKTDALLSDTEKTLNSLVFLNARIDTVDEEMRIARLNNDHAAQVALERQKEELQKRLLATQTDAVVASRARDIAARLYVWRQMEDRTEDAATTRLGSETRESNRNKVRGEYQAQLHTLVSDANLYRAAILQRFPVSRTETPTDKKWEAAFDQESIDYENFDAKNAGLYLTDLANELSPK
jgi:hypothetical protein